MVHNNIHIPTESWPVFTWFVIEFILVVAASNGIAYSTYTSFEGVVGYQALECEQDSHILKCAPPDEPVRDEATLNWIYWGIVGACFCGWYLVIRPYGLKKPILKDRI